MVNDATVVSFWASPGLTLLAENRLKLRDLLEDSENLPHDRTDNLGVLLEWLEVEVGDIGKGNLWQQRVEEANLGLGRRWSRLLTLNQRLLGLLDRRYLLFERRDIRLGLLLWLLACRDLRRDLWHLLLKARNLGLWLLLVGNDLGLWSRGHVSRLDKVIYVDPPVGIQDCSERLGAVCVFPLRLAVLIGGREDASDLSKDTDGVDLVHASDHVTVAVAVLEEEGADIWLTVSYEFANRLDDCWRGDCNCLVETWEQGSPCYWEC